MYTFTYMVGGEEGGGVGEDGRPEYLQDKTRQYFIITVCISTLSK